MSGKRRWHWFCLALVSVFLGLAATTVAGGAPASPDVPDAPRGDVTDSPTPLPPTTGVAPARTDLLRSEPPGGPAAIESVAGSDVTTANCYEPGQLQRLCFSVYNGSTDLEWLDGVRLTFPDYAGLGPWTVECDFHAAQDSAGHAVAFACSTPSTNEVVYSDSDGAEGEITGGATWGFCVDVTIPAGYNGPRYVNWGLSGDEEPGSAVPHDVTGSTEMEMCDPLMLRPTSRVAEGCNGITQTYDFELWNNTGVAGAFTLTYDVSSGNGNFAGPSGVSLTAGEIVSVTTQLKPDVCLAVGDQVVATLNVEGNGYADSATIIQSVGEYSGWAQRAPSPQSTMDNAVAWAVHDGGLWSVGGYGSDRSVQRYDPSSDSWTVTHTQQMTPAIEYPMDGCYGLDEDRHEVIVLFPDTIYTGTLQRYDITDDSWDAPAIPPGYPPEGRWAHDVVSKYGPTGENVCYLSGGSTKEGGGRVRDLWAYYPATNTTTYLGSFGLHGSGFNFHASWYVPWVGASGAVCVGGGIPHDGSVITATQCYDLATGTFNAPNDDLGPLPEPWWGMADGWKEHNGLYQIWLANGVAKDWSLIGKSAYADESTGGFAYGPEPATELYRLEGDGWKGHFYAEQGAEGGFVHTTNNELLVQCPACIEWGKWVGGSAWSPGVTITVEMSDTIEIVDVFTTNQPVTLFEYWDVDQLQLLDWSVQPAVGSVVAGTGEFTWDLPSSGFQVVTLTKWFHVEPCTWTQTVITEVLGSQQQVIEERLVEIEKEPAALWIESYYDPAAFAGQSAFFTLEYGNQGGYENSVWISNTFPVEAPFLWSDPAPTSVDPGGLWARWDVGDLANGNVGSIVVEVGVDAGVAISTRVPIWDGVFNHVDVLRGETLIEFVVEAPPEAIWEKWIEGEPWHPEISISVETSQTVTVVDVVETLAGYVLEEEWDSERLSLQEVQTTIGSISDTVGRLEWIVEPGEPQVAIITKTFHVEPSTWEAVQLWEGLWVDGVLQEPKHVMFVKDQPELWIEAVYDPDVLSGGPATFDLVYGNAGGFESRAWISNTFPVEARFDGSDPPPVEVGEGARWAMWELGPLEREEQGVIAVTIAVSPGLPISTSIGIWDGIFNHLDEIRDEIFIDLHVGPPPPPEWGKWINGEPWTPDLVVTTETSKTLEIMDVFVAEHAFNLTEVWVPEELALTEWTIEPPGVGVVTGTEGFLEWLVPPLGEPQLITLTKTYQVLPCVWEATVLREMLSVGDEVVEKRPVFVVKEQPELWIESAYEPEIAPGQVASFTLRYGNDGGYENDVMIGNEFPPEAPFESSEPPPAEVAEDRRTVWWSVGDLARNDGGTITVTVAITETLPYSTSVGIWDGIYNHVGELQGETFIEFTIPPLRVYLPLVMRDHGG